MSFPKKYIILALFGFSMVENKLFTQYEPEIKAEIFKAKNLIFAEFLGNSGSYALK